MLEELFHQQKDYINHFFSSVDLQKAEKILSIFLQCQGTILFTGVGKSGIIAEKLAMTLISTGTKSLYLPAMNALHGDIGILSEKDLFIFLSKSGESEELLQLLPAVRNRGAKTIAFVSKMPCRLAQLTDEFMHLPLKRELCPFDLAPTTSATLQLIFGDILAVALMKKKQFSLNEYALNHPAGSIGKKITLKVQDLMLKGEELPLCSLEDTLAQALVVLSNKRCGCVLAVDKEKKFQGIFTDGDLRRAIQSAPEGLLQKKMSSLITKSFISIEKQKMAIDAMKTMQKDPKKWVKELPVLENGKIIGLIRMHDIVQSGIS
ncbi:MAG: KpsF/GutQ family sugar-phosphate isomerase [Simkaniaceae bacterium]